MARWSDNFEVSFLFTHKHTHIAHAHTHHTHLTFIRRHTLTFMPTHSVCVCEWHYWVHALLS